MNWYHEADKEWLAARKNFLCASDIVKLLPTTPTGRPRKDLGGAYLGVWAEKQCVISENDSVCRGAMARGHILESYAVDEVNSQGFFKSQLHHWDDRLVFRGGVSCSPDALDRSMVTTGAKAVDGSTVGATFVAEIKAYTASKHYEMSNPNLDKMDIMERWQLATAFYVMPSIENGALVFYNPSAVHPVFIREYSRSELSAELIVIHEIAGTYETEAASYDKLYASSVLVDARTEAGIILELENLSLNP